MCWHTEHHFAAGPAAPRQARSFAVIELEEALSSPATDILHDVALVLSELVSNAVEAGSATIDVTLDLHRSALSISVHDHAQGWPMVQPRSADRSHGRGLALVAALTAGWGVDGDESGKRVWARVAVPDELIGSLECSHRHVDQQGSTDPGPAPAGARTHRVWAPDTAPVTR